MHSLLYIDLFIADTIKQDSNPNLACFNNT
jgi:hypothetical protein